ncbi:MAG: hypothetical protein A2004_04655 [Spirochaetes bacterium GWC1_61_12]|nr:MAG: hypothetical protein A2004_04655 [Spirochaetes bacterium GWC1_61_12]
MTPILDIFTALDGLDVTVLLPSGDRHTFHFADPPVDVQAAVDALVVAMTPPPVGAVAEDGTIIPPGD